MKFQRSFDEIPEVIRRNFQGHSTNVRRNVRRNRRRNLTKSFDDFCSRNFPTDFDISPCPAISSNHFLNFVVLFIRPFGWHFVGPISSAPALITPSGQKRPAGSRDGETRGQHKPKHKPTAWTWGLGEEASQVGNKTTHFQFHPTSATYYTSRIRSHTDTKQILELLCP